jgi:hypothetical protein
LRAKVEKLESALTAAQVGQLRSSDGYKNREEEKMNEKARKSETRKLIGFLDERNAKKTALKRVS